jgi:hypothetical protein
VGAHRSNPCRQRGWIEVIPPLEPLFYHEASRSFRCPHCKLCDEFDGTGTIRVSFLCHTTERAGFQISDIAINKEDNHISVEQIISIRCTRCREYCSPQTAWEEDKENGPR